MVLAQPVENFQGLLLLNKGTQLTEKNIRVLKSWGIIKIHVEGDERENHRDYEPGNEIRESIEKELKQKFSGVSEYHVMAEIMRMASKQLQKRYLRKQEENGNG